MPPKSSLTSGALTAIENPLRSLVPAGGGRRAPARRRINDEGDAGLRSVDVVANAAIVIIILPESRMSVDRVRRMCDYDRLREPGAGNVNVGHSRDDVMTWSFRGQS